MIDVALCMLALMAGGVTLELFCDKPTIDGHLAHQAVTPANEFECGNPS